MGIIIDAYDKKEGIFPSFSFYTNYVSNISLFFKY